MQSFRLLGIPISGRILFYYFQEILNILHQLILVQSVILSKHLIYLDIMYDVHSSNVCLPKTQVLNDIYMFSPKSFHKTLAFCHHLHFVRHNVTVIKLYYANIIKMMVLSQLFVLSSKIS